MTTVAQGVAGFNPPSLFSLSVGGPFFHAGNARTLEEVFDKTFNQHHQAHASSFLGDDTTRTAQIAELVAFLLSIDASATPVPVPTSATLGYDVDLCKQTGGVVIP